MSLKAGAKRTAAGPPFGLVLREKIASGKVGNLLLVFHFSTRRRGGGNVGIAQRFPRAVDNEGNLPLVFLVVQQTGISTALRFHALLRR